FGVSLDKLVPGAAIFWNSNAVNVSTGEFVSAADAEEAVIFFARNGDETSVVPSDRFVNVAAYLEPGLEYSPTISTVQIPDAASGVSSSSGGCNSELTLVSAVMMSLLLILTRRKL
ncbi:MAG: hypothetical protein IJR11_04695, partial [Synergistaceae bacterium]|nr:hypothetical protein [Synergistaceae bacterium]